MVGNGPDREFLLAEIQRLKLDGVTLAGFVTDDQKARLLKEASYFFFPSYEEGWGIAPGRSPLLRLPVRGLRTGALPACFRQPPPAYARLGRLARFPPGVPGSPGPRAGSGAKKLFAAVRRP